MTFRYKYIPAGQEFNLLNVQEFNLLNVQERYFEYYGPFEIFPNYVKIAEVASADAARLGVKYCGLVIPKRKRK